MDPNVRDYPGCTPPRDATGHGEVSAGQSSARIAARAGSEVHGADDGEEAAMLARIVGVSALVLAALLVAQHLASQDPSYADGPLPSVRAVLDCDGWVYQSRQEARPGKAEKGLGQATPELALQTGLYSGDEWWISVEGFRVAHLKESREIFSFDVGGRSRFAALVEDSPAAGGWLLTSWAMCDPSELTDGDADRLGYGVWLDTQGDPVPTETV